MRRSRCCPYLDGHHRLSDIGTELSAELSSGDVLSAVHQYEVMGHLAEGRPDLPLDEFAFWDAGETDPARARAQVDAAVVGLVP